jgi:hypothetical protein
VVIDSLLALSKIFSSILRRANASAMKRFHFFFEVECTQTQWGGQQESSWCCEPRVHRVFVVVESTNSNQCKGVSISLGPPSCFASWLGSLTRTSIDPAVILPKSDLTELEPLILIQLNRLLLVRYET